MINVLTVIQPQLGTHGRTGGIIHGREMMMMKREQEGEEGEGEGWLGHSESTEVGAHRPHCTEISYLYSTMNLLDGSLSLSLFFMKSSYV